jgi:hypothetical protein
MRKLLFPLLFVVAHVSHAQVQHPFRVQVYTGGPSLLKLAFKFSGQFQDKITYDGQPGFGGEVGYRFNRWFSAGLDVNYRYGELHMDVTEPEFFQELDEKWGIDLGVYDPFGHYKMEINRLRFTLIGNLHLLSEEVPSDLYISMGLGYNHVDARLFLDEKEINYSEKLGTISLPVAYRVSAGYAYHFGSVIGFFGEVGLGGPLLSAGITARF